MRRNQAELVLLSGLAVLALLVRWVGHDEITPDMRTFVAWYTALDGFPGLGKEVGNYNAPFLYLLAALHYLPGPAIIKIKMLWVLFDALLVYFTYRIVALRWPGRRIPTLAALVMAFLPTVVINSSVYGQCDAIWGSLSLGGLYFLLRGKQWWGVALCTVALAFKPQAIFLFPLLGLLVLAGSLRWRTLLVVPLGYLVLDLPALLLGRGPGELLTVYAPDRQAQWSSALSYNAANLWAFLPVGDRLGTLKSLGYLFTAILVLGLIYTLIAGRYELDGPRIVTAAAVFAILVPFVLPGMHERYFYLADVLTVVLACYRPRLWFVPLLVQAASLLSYLPFLFWELRHGPFVDLRILTTLMLAALLVTGYALLTSRRAESPAPLPIRPA